MANVSDEMRQKKGRGKIAEFNYTKTPQKKERAQSQLSTRRQQQEPGIGPIPETEPRSLSTISPPVSLNGNSNCSSIITSILVTVKNSSRICQ
ncbi:hypothetical protein CEXT_455951 [Caerostris extrusa]|uniref:Uncharacterized protein n=1 Tax=Caerostris extrusa TaxID=172846 RepID=A0AAV4RFT5_CAEEX|nr:hypothetical protein CEXT_455951 [Caerostris extrusa]